MKRIALIGVVILAGCATTMQQNSQRPTSADDPSRTCFDAIQFDQRLQILSPKIGAVVGHDRATIEMMASKDTPTDEEKKALSIWASARQTCHETGKAFRAAYAPPGWAATIDAQQSATLQAIANLYSGNLTYGQFIAERTRIALATEAQLRNVSDRDDAARAQQAQQNQNRANAAVQMMLQQQQIQQMNRPINTTCNRFGTMVNCTTN